MLILDGSRKRKLGIDFERLFGTNQIKQNAPCHNKFYFGDLDCTLGVFSLGPSDLDLKSTDWNELDSLLKKQEVCVGKHLQFNRL